MNAEPVFFASSRGKKLAGRLYSSDVDNDVGLIFCHGLFSTKDGYKITRMAGPIVHAGFTVLAFDFSYAGESEGSIAEMSVAQNVDDIASAAAFFKERGMQKIHLMGSSMGGASAVLYAAQQGSALASLIVIATPLDLKALILGNSGVDINDIDSLPPDGMTSLQGIEINNSFYREVAGLNIVDLIKKIKVPVFIIHGKDDAVVPFNNTEIFEKNLSSPPATLYIEDGDHNLTRDEDITGMTLEIISWLEKH